PIAPLGGRQEAAGDAALDLGDPVLLAPRIVEHGGDAAPDALRIEIEPLGLARHGELRRQDPRRFRRQGRPYRALIAHLSRLERGRPRSAPLFPKWARPRTARLSLSGALSGAPSIARAAIGSSLDPAAPPQPQSPGENERRWDSSTEPLPAPVSTRPSRP